MLPTTAWPLQLVSVAKPVMSAAFLAIAAADPGRAAQLIEHALPWWAFLLVAVAVLLVATEIGFRIGRRSAGAATEGRQGQAGVLIGALLALLGLLLAFSFSIVESRFAARKSLVLEEANAIGTAYLRAQTVPDPQGPRLEELLREYVQTRTQIRTSAELERALRASEVLHRGLWKEATETAKAHPDSEVVALFLASLNEVIDLHESRVTVALYQRLPRPILWTLYVVSILSMGLLGYGAGIGRWRSPFATVALTISVASVIVLIVELDRPGGRLFRVNQHALEDLRETVAQDDAGVVAGAATPGRHTGANLRARSRTP